MKISKNELHSLVNAALKEDLALAGDITTAAIYRDGKKSICSICAKSEGTLAGLELAKMVFHSVDRACKFQALRRDGDTLLVGDVIAKVSGPASSLVTAERTALNFLIFMSGIATRAREYADALKGSNITLLDTRKTAPGLRLISKSAVAAGGGANHRMGLYDMYLIKDNHIVQAGGIAEALTRVYAAKKEKTLVEIEVDDLQQLEQALKFPIDIIMLDNMSNKKISEASRKVRLASQTHGKKILIEVSGNIDLKRLRILRSLDIDLVSSSKITMQPAPVDINLEMK